MNKQNPLVQLCEMILSFVFMVGNGLIYIVQSICCPVKKPRGNGDERPDERPDERRENASDVGGSSETTEEGIINAPSIEELSHSIGSKTKKQQRKELSKAKKRKEREERQEALRRMQEQKEEKQKKRLEKEREMTNLRIQQQLEREINLEKEKKNQEDKAYFEYAHLIKVVKRGNVSDLPRYDESKFKQRIHSERIIPLQDLQNDFSLTHSQILEKADAMKNIHIDKVNNLLVYVPEDAIPKAMKVIIQKGSVSAKELVEIVQSSILTDN